MSISLAGMVEDAFVAGQTEHAWEMLKDVPKYQMEIWWDVFEKFCLYRLTEGVVPRPVNGLNIEIGAPLPRCSALSPDGLGLRWYMSGGPISAYGVCCRKNCTLIKEAPDPHQHTREQS